MSELSDVKLEIQRTGRLLEKLQISMSDVQQQAHDIKTLVAGNKELGIPGHGDTLQDHESRIEYLERSRGKDLVDREKDKLKNYKKLTVSFLGGAGATGAGIKTGLLAKFWAFLTSLFT